MDISNLESLMKKHTEWDERGDDGESILHLAMSSKVVFTYIHRGEIAMSFASTSCL